jgi:hypothetical protein
VKALAALLLLTSAALARDPDGRYAESPHAHWFKTQHNEQGEWCCDNSDGHPYFGDYSFNADGSVNVTDEAGKPHKLPAYMVLKGSNPTGHAVLWYTDHQHAGHRDYCFAPGGGA